MTELIICPLCAKAVHRHAGGPVETRISVSSRFARTTDVLQALVAMAEAEQECEAETAEQACVTHYEQEHQLRYLLWKRLGWNRLLTWSARNYVSLPEDQTFELLKFMKKST